MTRSGLIADLDTATLTPGTLTVQAGRIAAIDKTGAPLPFAPDTPLPAGTPLLLPGFVDAHVHVESSMLPPREFGRLAAIHGTVATVSDPHEIANVLGIEGVRWMIEDSQHSPVKILFGAPSCVPATPFETAGASFGPEEVATLLDDPGIGYLSEVMNFPAVIKADPRMLAIINEARKRGMRVDGHSPGVVDEALDAYAGAGIETDHERTTLEEGRQCCQHGMKIAIREGSAARNFDALWPLLNEFPEQVFFCSDDKHPDDLIISQIDDLVRRACRKGVPPLAALRAACLNPVRHYGLNCGLLHEGDPADFIELAPPEKTLTLGEFFQHFRVRRTVIDGTLAAEDDKPALPFTSARAANLFKAKQIRPEAFEVPAVFGKQLRVIEALDGQLLTRETDENPSMYSGCAVADPARDLLKIAVINRYTPGVAPAVGFIRNFGLRTGAMASSVAHDSHNIVAVGVSDEALARAVNLVVQECGGLSCVRRQENRNWSELAFPLPIAGLMSLADGWEAATAFKKLTAMAKSDGCRFHSPFMTLSFMALLVIPSLKIGDRGLFDVDAFAPANLFAP